MVRMALLWKEEEKVGLPGGRDEKGSRANRGKEALLLPWEEG